MLASACVRKPDKLAGLIERSAVRPKHFDGHYLAVIL